MDFIDNRTHNIMQRSLDGLYERSKAIASNTANALTPGYKRREVSFEESLQKIIQNENEKENIRLQNAMMYQKNPNKVLYGQSPEQIAFLNSDMNKEFFINVQEDMSQGYDVDGNNVNIETEMMDETQNSMRYNVVANLLSKSYQQLNNVIRGQNS